MDRTLLTRFLVIMAIIAIAAFQAYPPAESINLGLDLQGGMHLVLRVHTDDALKAETDNCGDRHGASARRSRDGRSNRSAPPTPPSASTDWRPTRWASSRDTIESRGRLPGWNVVREADGALSFSMTASEVANVRQSAVDQAQQTIRNRIDEFGVAEPIVHDEGLGSERIVVQLPGVDDPERVKELIKSTAILELYLVAKGTTSAPTEQRAIDQLPAGSAPTTQVVRAAAIRRRPEPRSASSSGSLETSRVISGRDSARRPTHHRRVQRCPRSASTSTATAAASSARSPRPTSAAAVDRARRQVRSVATIQDRSPTRASSAATSPPGSPGSRHGAQVRRPAGAA